MTESNKAVPAPSAEVMQLARLLQARDALAFGYVVDVVVHPTWEEESFIGRDDYITQAASTLDLVRLCGWSSGEELERARATAVRLEQMVAMALEILTREGVWLQREHAAVKALSGQGPEPEFGPRFDPIRSAEWERIERERDALRARIEAARSASSTPEDVDSAGWAVGQDARLVSLYRRALDRVDAALAGDQPAPEPAHVSAVTRETLDAIRHLVDVARDNGLDDGETVEEWVRGYADWLESEYGVRGDAEPAGDSTPEPPRLDPEPWRDLSTNTRAPRPPSPILVIVGKWQFDPRLGYSPSIEDYGQVQS